ncbi:hypothetical protein BTN50_1846 [Candidatus Enterovibrio altilux]|uniref:Mobile element protein n=1 Tax=Candidatus Enterovibrio altilux TaxID=1927128 RepID=A0A291BB86_9GAMM|nr:hypothetical protein BTN50_1846 [Candidatus Enterovibrio luxaltus]
MHAITTAELSALNVANGERQPNLLKQSRLKINLISGDGCLRD